MKFKGMKDSVFEKTKVDNKFTPKVIFVPIDLKTRYSSSPGNSKGFEKKFIEFDQDLAILRKVETC